MLFQRPLNYIIFTTFTKNIDSYKFVAKYTITLEEDYDFDLIGISCHSKNYRLCWTINNALKTELKRVSDLEIIKKKETLSFCFYEYLDRENNIDYFLIANKSGNGFLVSEKPSVDYFFVLKGSTTKMLMKNILKKLNTHEIILMAYAIDINELKSNKNLLF